MVDRTHSCVCEHFRRRLDILEQTDFPIRIRIEQKLRWHRFHLVRCSLIYRDLVDIDPHEPYILGQLKPRRYEKQSTYFGI